MKGLIPHLAREAHGQVHLDPTRAVPKRDLRWLAELSPGSWHYLRQQVDEHLSAESLSDYVPYPKQLQFHIAGKRFRHRLIRAGNQQGKSYPTAAEFAMHVTGEYKPNWEGYRYPHPITAWACGEDAVATRDNAQRLLFGEIGEQGSGLIPARTITKDQAWSNVNSDLLDYARIRHASGGYSFVRFRFYSQKRTAWQGPPVHLLWYDEEPPLAMYQEGRARLIAVDGRSMMSMSLLQGSTEVANTYIDPAKRPPDMHDTRMEIYDSLHIDPERIPDIIASFPEHQRAARIFGHPMRGSGLIYPVSEDQFVVEPREIPDWWHVIGGLDFGTGKHTAGVRLAWDRDVDCLYVTHEYQQDRSTIAEHCLTLQHWGEELVWAWPRDGYEKEQGSGKQVAEVYRRNGLNMHFEHAHYAETMAGQGPNRHKVSTERGIDEILERLKTGRFKVFKTCESWLHERRNYHRKEGLIVKIDDHLLDATRTAVMGLRYASRIEPKARRVRRRKRTWKTL